MRSFGAGDVGGGSRILSPPYTRNVGRRQTDRQTRSQLRGSASVPVPICRSSAPTFRVSTSCSRGGTGYVVSRSCPNKTDDGPGALGGSLWAFDQVIREKGGATSFRGSVRRAVDWGLVRIGEVHRGVGGLGKGHWTHDRCMPCR